MEGCCGVVLCHAHASMIPCPHWLCAGQDVTLEQCHAEDGLKAAAGAMGASGLVSSHVQMCMHEPCMNHLHPHTQHLPITSSSTNGMGSISKAVYSRVIRVACFSICLDFVAARLLLNMCCCAEHCQSGRHRSSYHGAAALCCYALCLRYH